MITTPTATLETDPVAHRERIISQFTADFRAKYDAGQQEHGGCMAEKPGMLEHAIAEALDLVAYLYTLKDQRDGGFVHNGRDV